MSFLYFKYVFMTTNYSKVPPPPRTDVLSKLSKPSRRSFEEGLQKNFPVPGIFPIEYFFSYKLLLVCVTVCARNRIYVQFFPSLTSLVRRFSVFRTVLSAGPLCVCVRISLLEKNISIGKNPRYWGKFF